MSHPEETLSFETALFSGDRLLVYATADGEDGRRRLLFEATP
jgi:hypothetical protein